MKGCNVDIFVKEVAKGQNVTYNVEVWLVDKATEETLKSFIEISKSSNLSLDYDYRMAYARRGKKCEIAINLATNLAMALRKANFKVYGALIREDMMENERKVVKLPNIPLSKRASMKAPRELLEILQKKLKESI